MFVLPLDVLLSKPCIALQVQQSGRVIWDYFIARNALFDKCKERGLTNIDGRVENGDLDADLNDLVKTREHILKDLYPGCDVSNMDDQKLLSGVELNGDVVYGLGTYVNLEDLRKINRAYESQIYEEIIKNRPDLISFLGGSFLYEKLILDKTDNIFKQNFFTAFKSNSFGKYGNVDYISYLGPLLKDMSKNICGPLWSLINTHRDSLISVSNMIKNVLTSVGKLKEQFNKDKTTDKNPDTKNMKIGDLVGKTEVNLESLKSELDKLKDLAKKAQESNFPLALQIDLASIQNKKLEDITEQDLKKLLDNISSVRNIESSEILDDVLYDFVKFGYKNIFESESTTVQSNAYIFICECIDKMSPEYLYQKFFSGKESKEKNYIMDIYKFIYSGHNVPISYDRLAYNKKTKKEHDRFCNISEPYIDFYRKDKKFGCVRQYFLLFGTIMSKLPYSKGRKENLNSLFDSELLEDVWLCNYGGYYGSGSHYIETKEICEILTLLDPNFVRDNLKSTWLKKCLNYDSYNEEFLKLIAKYDKDFNDGLSEQDYLLKFIDLTESSNHCRKRSYKSLGINYVDIEFIYQNFDQEVIKDNLCYLESADKKLKLYEYLYSDHVKNNNRADDILLLCQYWENFYKNVDMKIFVDNINRDEFRSFAKNNIKGEDKQNQIGNAVYYMYEKGQTRREYLVELFNEWHYSLIECKKINIEFLYELLHEDGGEKTKKALSNLNGDTVELLYKYIYPKYKKDDSLCNDIFKLIDEWAYYIANVIEAEFVSKYLDQKPMEKILERMNDSKHKELVDYILKNENDAEKQKSMILKVIEKDSSKYYLYEYLPIEFICKNLTEPLIQEGLKKLTWGSQLDIRQKIWDGIDEYCDADTRKNYHLSLIEIWDDFYDCANFKFICDNFDEKIVKNALIALKNKSSAHNLFTITTELRSRLYKRICEFTTDESVRNTRVIFLIEHWDDWHEYVDKEFILKRLGNEVIQRRLNCIRDDKIKQRLYDLIKDFTKDDLKKREKYILACINAWDNWYKYVDMKFICDYFDNDIVQKQLQYVRCSDDFKKFCDYVLETYSDNEKRKEYIFGFLEARQKSKKFLPDDVKYYTRDHVEGINKQFIIENIDCDEIKNLLGNLFLNYGWQTKSLVRDLICVIENMKDAKDQKNSYFKLVKLAGKNKCVFENTSPEFFIKHLESERMQKYLSKYMKENEEMYLYNYGDTKPIRVQGYYGDTHKPVLEFLFESISKEADYKKVLSLTTILMQNCQMTHFRYIYDKECENSIFWRVIDNIQKEETKKETWDLIKNCVCCSGDGYFLSKFIENILSDSSKENVKNCNLDFKKQFVKFLLGSEGKDILEANQKAGENGNSCVCGKLVRFVEESFEGEEQVELLQKLVELDYKLVRSNLSMDFIAYNLDKEFIQDLVSKDKWLSRDNYGLPDDRKIKKLLESLYKLEDSNRMFLLISKLISLKPDFVLQYVKAEWLLNNFDGDIGNIVKESLSAEVEDRNSYSHLLSNLCLCIQNKKDDDGWNEDRKNKFILKLIGLNIARSFHSTWVINFFVDNMDTDQTVAKLMQDFFVDNQCKEPYKYKWLLDHINEKKEKDGWTVERKKNLILTLVGYNTKLATLYIKEKFLLENIGNDIIKNLIKQHIILGYEKKKYNDYFGGSLSGGEECLFERLLKYLSDKADDEIKKDKNKDKIEANNNDENNKTNNDDQKNFILKEIFSLAANDKTSVALDIIARNLDNKIIQGYITENFNAYKDLIQSLLNYCKENQGYSKYYMSLVFCIPNADLKDIPVEFWAKHISKEEVESKLKDYIASPNCSDDWIEKLVGTMKEDEYKLLDELLPLCPGRIIKYIYCSLIAKRINLYMYEAQDDRDQYCKEQVQVIELGLKECTVENENDHVWAKNLFDVVYKKSEERKWCQCTLMSNFILCNPGLFMKYVDINFLTDNFNDNHIKKLLGTYLKLDNCNDDYVKKLVEALDTKEQSEADEYDKIFSGFSECRASNKGKYVIELLSFNPNQVIKYIDANVIYENQYKENIGNALKNYIQSSSCDGDWIKNLVNLSINDEHFINKLISYNPKLLIRFVPNKFLIENFNDDNIQTGIKEYICSDSYDKNWLKDLIGEIKTKDNAKQLIDQLTGYNSERVSSFIKDNQENAKTGDDNIKLEGEQKTEIIVLAKDKTEKVKVSKENNEGDSNGSKSQQKKSDVIDNNESEKNGSTDVEAEVIDINRNNSGKKINSGNNKSQERSDNKNEKSEKDDEREKHKETNINNNSSIDDMNEDGNNDNKKDKRNNSKKTFVENRNISESPNLTIENNENEEKVIDIRQNNLEGNIENNGENSLQNKQNDYRQEINKSDNRYQEDHKNSVLDNQSEEDLNKIDKNMSKQDADRKNGNFIEYDGDNNLNDRKNIEKQKNLLGNKLNTNITQQNQEFKLELTLSNNKTIILSPGSCKTAMVELRGCSDFCYQICSIKEVIERQNCHQAFEYWNQLWNELPWGKRIKVTFYSWFIFRIAKWWHSSITIKIKSTILTQSKSNTNFLKLNQNNNRFLTLESKEKTFHDIDQSLDK